ncbi:hypothetical protein [Anabaena azotica]|uniref:Uncharacterized protein n=1 Tax=Anabaena azotica FACHB-119 TaxID=947527 RepID=A0ABR8DEM2_9NOST|nr:hypothetical protein [Anabaena azotica]MBD2505690.1 hypothetical protein [Anabaena azotica FACHB-119]
MSSLDKEKLKSIVSQSPGITTEELRQQLGVVNGTVIRTAKQTDDIEVVKTSKGYKFFPKVSDN